MLPCNTCLTTVVGWQPVLNLKENLKENSYDGVFF